MLKLARNLVIAAVALSVVLVAADPFAGNWKFNPTKSKFTKGKGPKEQNVTIVESAGNLEISTKATSMEGKTTSTKYTIPAKGGDGKMIESPVYDAVKSKRPSNTEREVQYSKGGKVTTTLHIMVAPDGKTMTAHVKGVNLLGEPIEGATVFDRQ